MNIAPSGTTPLLRGTISGYRKKRQVKDLLITPADRGATGAAAILAALAGQGGAAVAGLNAMNIREEADFVEFELNGEPVEGWLTFAPFKNGDEVIVVASRENSGWHAFGVMRSDYVTALHPCCSRGRYAHFKATVKWWLLISFIIIIVYLLLGILLVRVNETHLSAKYIAILFLGSPALFLAITSLIASSVARKYTPAVRLAESIFACFGWKNVKSIDLPAITKKYKETGEGLEVGMLYFRCGKDSLDERLTSTSRI
jgi:hypothetical protein